METMLSMEEVAVAVGVSRQTIYHWYKFKKENPDSDYAKLLPIPFIGRRNQHLWRKSDIDVLIRFKKLIPKGRNGIMGSVTQRYVRKAKV